MNDRDPSKPNTEQGLYRKFDVIRTDGSDQPGGKHEGCEYFVLDMTHDSHAKAAAAAYADSVEATHPMLAADMREQYGLAAALREQPEARGVVDALSWELRQRAKHAGVVTGELLNKAADALDAITAAQQPVQEGGGEDDDSVDRCESALPTCGAAVAWDEDGIGACERCAKELGWLAQQAAPPSAPVGVDELVATLIDAAYQDGTQEMDEMSADTLRARSAVVQALTQQPAQTAPGDDIPDLYRDDWISLRELDSRIETLAEEYEWRGDDGDYTPNEQERAMLIDFSHGILADEIFVAMMKAHHDPNAKGRPTPPGDDAAGGGS